MTNEQIKIPTIQQSNGQSTTQQHLVYLTENPLNSNFLFYIFIAFCIGFIKYYYTQVVVLRLKPILFEGLIYGSVSSISGYIAINLIIYFNIINIGAIGAIVGTSGWMGVKFIESFEKTLTEGLIDRLKQSLLTLMGNKKDIDK